ncbi:hypothetical protein SDC9_173618 [bioreactor metagenome]|uniref:Uncharacterized protein n=1 Tax=bioreactor metagenome TaxID=1076179 RepID=A0A645GQF7_9ZZZZ
MSGDSGPGTTGSFIDTPTGAPKTSALAASTLQAPRSADAPPRTAGGGASEREIRMGDGFVTEPGAKSSVRPSAAATRPPFADREVSARMGPGVVSSETAARSGDKTTDRRSLSRRRAPRAVRSGESDGGSGIRAAGARPSAPTSADATRIASVGNASVRTTNIRIAGARSFIRTLSFPENSA